MGRSYDIKIDGIFQQYPSVTTVLGVLDKPALIPWAVGCAIDYIGNEIFKIPFDMAHINPLLDKARKEWRLVSKEACDIGSEIHDLIEKYIKFGRDAIGKLRPEVENGFLAFLEWEDENGVEWLESEATVWDDRFCFAGTLDTVCKMTKGKNKGWYGVLDFKSSKGFYPEYATQIAAYKSAYQNMTEKETPNMGVLRLDKVTGQPEFKDYSDKYDNRLDAFLALLTFYYKDKKRKLKNNPRVKG